MRFPPPATIPMALAITALGSCGRERVRAIQLEELGQSTGIDVRVKSGDSRRWYIPESNGSGAAWLDYDSDGDMDLLIGNGASVNYLDDGKRLEIVKDGGTRLYAKDWKESHPFPFVDATETSGLSCKEWVNGIATGDIEGDGDTDVYFANFGPDALYRNEGGKFRDTTEACGLRNEKWGASAAFADVDNDGDLDLYVANYCEFDPENPPAGGKRNVIQGVEVGWGPEKENPGINVGAPDAFFRNQGKGLFKNETAEAGLALAKPLCSYAVVFSDIDQDGWQDILVANDGQPSNLFHNRGLGRFTEEGEARGFAFDAKGQATAAMGLTVEDFDGDGDMDVFRTNFDMEANSLLVNDGKGNFTDRADELGLAAPSLDRLGWACAFWDGDNDGDYDILVANGHVYPQAEKIGMHAWLQRSQLFECYRDGAGKLKYRDRSSQITDPFSLPAAARGIAIGDPNNDGREDVVIVDIDGPPRVFRNVTRDPGHFITVRLIGEISNRDGYGARVTVFTGGRSFVREMRTSQGLYSSHDPRLHFGLGDEEAVIKVVVEWPSGTIQIIEKPQIDTFITVRESSNAPR